MNNQAEQLALGQLPEVDATPDINMENLIQEWNLSKGYIDQYTRDFPQLDMLTDGVPLNADPENPFVGDTTLAGIVRQIPRKSLQQLPVYQSVVNGSKINKAAILCSFFLKKFAFNEDTFGKGLLSTLQLGAEQALTHGFAPFMVSTGMVRNDFGTRLRLLHYLDTAPEPGITDHDETGYDYVVSNLTPGRVRKMLANARNNPETSWVAEMLELLLQRAPKPTEYANQGSSSGQNAAAEAMAPVYQVITRYPTGTDEPIITFSPEVQEGPLRVMETRSKWGYPRVMYLVIDPAALTPFGKSRVRLASPNQNFMNIYYAQIASMLLLNSKPPIFKRGRFTRPVQLKRGAVWEALDPQAEAKLVNLDNGSLGQFVSISQQLAAQIKNIMGDPSSSPLGGSNAYSKVGPGVKMQQEDIDVSTNQITKILENFLRQYALVSLDTMLSELEGEDDIFVDDDTKNALNAIEPGFVGENNSVHMMWEQFYAEIEEWSVEITVSLSKDELDEKKYGDLQDILVVLAQNAKDNPEAAAKVTELTNMLMEKKAPLLKPLAPPMAAMPTAMPTPAEAPAPEPALV